MNRLESRISSELSHILQLLQQPMPRGPQGHTSCVLGAPESSDLALFSTTLSNQSPGPKIPLDYVPAAQTLSYGDLDTCMPKHRNSSLRMPHLTVAMDKILMPSSEQEQAGGLPSPLASPLCPLEVQGLIGGPHFSSLPEQLGSVPKQPEFQRYGSDPGLTS